MYLKRTEILAIIGLSILIWLVFPWSQDLTKIERLFTGIMSIVMALAMVTEIEILYEWITGKEVV